MKDPLNKPSFETMRWSVVISAGQDDSKLARDAMEQLCRRYWFPQFAFIQCLSDRFAGTFFAVK